MGAGCTVASSPTSYQTESKKTEAIQKNVIQAVPIPELTTSSERKNVARRAEIFNNEEKITYVYLVNYGKVMAFYTAKGKISSLRSYLAPTQKLVFGNGARCDEDNYDSTPGCYQIEAPEIDGTYGENVDGIFFFTTEDAYVEWHGDYMMSDQPLKLSTQPELIREIK